MHSENVVVVVRPLLLQTKLQNITSVQVYDSRDSQLDSSKSQQSRLWLSTDLWYLSEYLSISTATNFDRYRRHVVVDALTIRWECRKGWATGREQEKPATISVSGIGSDDALSRDNGIFDDRGGRMLTARSGPLGLGVPRTLGPAEGSDHLFLLPERALVMDSTHLRQDLAGLDFNLHLNLLHTAPRGNVWLCESLLCTRSTSGDDRTRVCRFLWFAKNLRGVSWSMKLVVDVARSFRRANCIGALPFQKAPGSR